MKKTYPEVALKFNHKALHNKVRTAIWSLKNKGEIEAKEIGNNKYEYSVKK